MKASSKKSRKKASTKISRLTTIKEVDLAAGRVGSAGLLDPDMAFTP